MKFSFNILKRFQVVRCRYLNCKSLVSLSKLIDLRRNLHHRLQIFKVACSAVFFEFSNFSPNLFGNHLTLIISRLLVELLSI